MCLVTMSLSLLPKFNDTFPSRSKLLRVPWLAHRIEVVRGTTSFFPVWLSQDGGAKRAEKPRGFILLHYWPAEHSSWLWSCGKDYSVSSSLNPGSSVLSGRCMMRSTLIEMACPKSYAWLCWRWDRKIWSSSSSSHFNFIFLVPSRQRGQFHSHTVKQ